MAEKDILFSSKLKHKGIFNFAAFYKFCYDWLEAETGLLLQESKYAEKLSGDMKEIDIEWNGFTKLTDYFRFDMKVTFKILAMKQVEIVQDGKKIKTNEGQVEMGVKGILTRDWQGAYEKSAFQKTLRTIYDKWLIPSRIDQFEGKVIGDSDEFLGQAKAWLSLEGKERH
ncbi:hypothetical protein HN832_03630 [archaeon]|jgi:hypothetical protein|nr:hypothetical protein [archaeon]MBT4373513.1 hypothetical protein [archaeon]MBT4531961.1 hypothetical protein [archaeon]MBT7001628.1 hypothetical protein [archaeon]MBT7282480.1 hypothetical protein [archaeon]